MTKEITLLALDPGTGNFGYAVLKGSLSAGSPPSGLRVEAFGRIHSTIREIKVGLHRQVELYWATIEKLVEDHKITHVVGERYQSRRMGGTTIECVNIMIGVVLTMCHLKSLPCKFIPASQWKNEMKRQGVDLEALYADLKPSGVTPHAIDAASIAEYGAYRLVGLKPFSETVNYEKRLNRLRSRVKYHADLGIPVKRVPKKRTKR